MNSNASKSRVYALALAALGVVFGDIGTSPLYTMREIFAGAHHPLILSEDNVFGILSLVFWSLIMIVCVKYLTFVLRADNRGEGGIMALLALASRTVAGDPRKQYALMMIGIVGACLFFADGMITPAISVMSAVEGLEIAAPALHSYVTTITLVIIFVLFWMQSKGTATIGAFFGPVMIVWFTTLGALGVASIIDEPRVLWALSPTYGFNFFATNPMIAFIALGTVVLAVTGTEAIYADMGHFGLKPIRMAWFTFVLPALVLNYFGQGALILRDATAVKNPFYLLAPEWMLYPLIGLATVATVIASQAVISGTFSVSRQALQLGFLPRMQIEHTSEREKGQIYMPRVNWGLMLAVMALVIGFGSSGNLAAAYGIAVTGDMVIATLLAAVVFHKVWGWSLLKTGLLVSLFLIIDLAFFSANLLKIMDGGWFPLLIGIVIFTVMTTWRRGRGLLLSRLKKEAMALDPFIESIAAHPPARVPGDAIFLTQNPEGVPHSLLHNLKHNKILHKRVVLLTVKIEDFPHTEPDDRVQIEDLSNGFYRVLVRYGFKDDPDIPGELELCASHGIEFNAMTTSFFIGKESLIATRDSEMAYWREKLFVGMFRNADSITNHFNLPPNRVIELGAQVTL